MIPTNKIYDYESDDSSSKGGYYDVMYPETDEDDDIDLEQEELELDDDEEP